jgi:hypothetical protein
LRPDVFQYGHFVQTNYCDICPGDRCLPDCRFAHLQGFFDDARSLQVARNKRHRDFVNKPCGKPKPMNTPLRPVGGVGRVSSQTLTYGQNMQILCEARENMSLHNRKTRDPEQQQFNGDVINLLGGITRTLDKVIRDTLRPDQIDKKEYSRYAVCQELYAHGGTTICHAWGPPPMTISKKDVDEKLKETVAASDGGNQRVTRSKTPEKTRASSTAPEKAQAAPSNKKRKNETEAVTSPAEEAAVASTANRKKKKRNAK